MTRARDIADLLNAAPPDADTLAELKAAIDDNSAELAGKASTSYVDTAVLQYLPAGTPFHWPGSSPPPGALARDGAAYSRTVYAALFAAIGTDYGAPDGLTFNVPDDRGNVDRGWDNGRGVDPGRVRGSEQLDAMQNITGTLNLSAGSRFGSGTGAFSVSGSTSQGAAAGGNSGTLTATFDASTQVRTATETRVRSRAYLACIKY